MDDATRASILNWRDETGRTALMWAAQQNHLQVCQLVRGCSAVSGGGAALRAVRRHVSAHQTMSLLVSTCAGKTVARPCQRLWGR
jgi:hypothetical protein